MTMNERTNYELLMTEAVVNKVRRYAGKLARRTHGAMEADDLINKAVEVIWRRESIQGLVINDDPDAMVKFLTQRVKLVFLEWAVGYHAVGKDGNPIPMHSERERYLATACIPEWHDHIKPLQVGNPSLEWETLYDVERALSTLTAAEQQLMRWMYWDGLTKVEIASRLGLGWEAIRRRVLRVLPKLRAALADYALDDAKAGPSGKTSIDSSGARV